MGYRSDVRIIVSKDGLKELRRVVREEAMKYATPDYDYNLLNSARILYNDDGYQVMIGWNSIKWYEGDYKDVDAIMKGLDELRRDGYSYSFARLGENYDDIEEDHAEGEEEDEVDWVEIVREFDEWGFKERDDLNV